MPYVKISDPNTIDLSAWHQVINVINQHSDAINAITNNFGMQGSGAIDWNAATDITHEYTPGSQKILYGKVKINTQDTDPNSGANPTTGSHVFYGNVDFADATTGSKPFKARPIVTVTAQFGSQEDSPPPVTSANVVCTVIAVTENKFTYRVTNARSTTTNPIPLTGYFYLNWTAIGPK